MGSQPPSVYWRRRLVLLASALALVLLVVLTVNVLFSGDPAPNAAGTTSASTRSTATHPNGSTSRSSSAPSSKTASTGTTSRTTSGTTSGTSSSRSSSTSAAPKNCTAAVLKLSTSSDESTYPMDGKPQLSLLVRNAGTAPCVQNLGDSQIVLRVYNGESRVWGSHDCKIDPTANVRTLAAGASVKLTIGWTGLASQPGQCTNRQHVGAGTYTLYGSLSGHPATASQFTVSS